MPYLNISASTFSTFSIHLFQCFPKILLVICQQIFCSYLGLSKSNIACSIFFISSSIFSRFSVSPEISESSSGALYGPGLRKKASIFYSMTAYSASSRRCSSTSLFISNCSGFGPDSGLIFSVIALDVLPIKIFDFMIKNFSFWLFLSGAVFLN